MEPASNLIVPTNFADQKLLSSRYNTIIGIPLGSWANKKATVGMLFMRRHSMWAERAGSILLLFCAIAGVVDPIERALLHRSIPRAVARSAVTSCVVTTRVLAQERSPQVILPAAPPGGPVSTAFAVPFLIAAGELPVVPQAVYESLPTATARTRGPPTF
jgi:hypothetical protein